MRAIELRLKGGNIKWLDYRPPHTLVAFPLALPPRIHALFAFFDRQQYKRNFFNSSKLKFKEGLGLKSSSLAVVWSLWFNIPNHRFDQNWEKAGYLRSSTCWKYIIVFKYFQLIVAWTQMIFQLHSNIYLEAHQECLRKSSSVSV